MIKEIVQAVEDGTPRLTVRQRYGVSEGTLCRWMADHGSASYHQSKRRFYSPRKNALSCGHRLRNECKTGQDQLWDQKQCDYFFLDQRIQKENDDLGIVNSLPMAKGVKNKETDEVKALREALAFAQLKIKALNTMIDIAEEQLKIDIRKKSGARQSPK